MTQTDRYGRTAGLFQKTFGYDGTSFYSAPGRSEIIGNHTDHNGGRIIAAGIDMDTVCCAAASGDDRVRLISEGYKEIAFSLKDIAVIPKNKGTLSLLAGLIEGVRDAGFKVSGFDMAVTTTVFPGAGVSSSASFEMLVTAAVNGLFNDGRMTVIDCAKAGQFAENVYWEKASGLMDQIACAAGGMVMIDLKDDARYEKMPFSFETYGYRMVICNTGKGHADLSAAYSAVPAEMYAVAEALGAKRLCETTKDALLSELPAIRKKLDNDRAILRALHFFDECERADRTEECMERGDIEGVLRLMEESGGSSLTLLQNGYLPENISEQSVPLALAVAKEALSGGKGICRLHGGGFGGVILSIVRDEALDDFTDTMARLFGRENVFVTSVREEGAVRVEV